MDDIGSTAVPGLPAKPFIDIMVLVHELTDGLRAVHALEAIGYSFWRANPNTKHLRLVKGLPPAAPRRTHHLHIIADPRELQRHTLFRDFLRPAFGNTTARASTPFDLNQPAYRCPDEWHESLRPRSRKTRYSAMLPLN